MLISLRALALACLLLPASVAAASALAPDTTGLQFQGFRAGASLEELGSQLAAVGGDPLRCGRSKIDPRVLECRARLRNHDAGVALDLWVSAIDSVAGVMTLSAVVGPEQLQHWQASLEERYGRVGTRVQGTQRMLQWVRRGRMLRLTWRVERNQKVASVSLVDGHVLDGWGRSRLQSARRPSLTVRAEQQTP